VRHELSIIAATACSFVSTFIAAVALAEVSADQARRLGGRELTPLGAERAGNATGTIPAWTGGITQPPPGFEPGKHHPDPHPEDPVLFTITAAELGEHSERLSEGQKALLRAHPDTWRMNVYPTRRSASYPPWVYEAVKANATTAEVVLEGKGGVVNAAISSPFPIPRSGVDVIWNHNLRWRGIHVSRSDGVAAVTRAGRYRLVLTEQAFAYPYASPRASAFKTKHPNVMLAVKMKVIAPALLAGDGILVIEPIDQTEDPRRSWTYSRNLRRVFRNPFLAYDQPALNSDGLRTVDEFGLYNGAPDRFEWTLLGKREVYVPYNAYRLHSSDVGHGDIIGRRHIAPDLARYELHRVWVVEGRLKRGQRHIYSRRVFYVDEDSWQIALSDSYDSEGNLWRTAEAHALNYYDVPVLWTTLEVFYDLKEGRYLVNGLDNHRNGARFAEDGDPREFSPNALTYYIR
jgi:hypothetical protein